MNQIIWRKFINTSNYYPKRYEKIFLHITKTRCYHDNVKENKKELKKFQTGLLKDLMGD